jgi:hypothetical protein
MLNVLYGGVNVSTGVAGGAGVNVGTTVGVSAKVGGGDVLVTMGVLD